MFLQPLYTPIQHTHTRSAHLLASPSYSTVVTALKPQFPLPFVGVLCCYIIIHVSTPADEGKRSIGQCACTGECTYPGECTRTGYLSLLLYIILLYIIFKLDYPAKLGFQFNQIKFFHTHTQVA